MALIVAIDLGSTNLKVGLVKDRKIKQVRTARLTTFSNEPGEACHNMNSIKAQLFTLLKDVVSLADEPVEGIVSTSYQFGMMLLNDLEKPLTPMTLLADTRAQATFKKFCDRVDGEALYKKTGCPLLSQYLYPRLFWLSQTSSDTVNKTRWMYDSKSWLFNWLTGQHVTDISTACATQLFNLQKMDWDDEILSSLGLSRSILPKVEDGFNYRVPLRQDLSNQLGLNSEIPVVLGVYDGAALALGLSGLEKNTAVINLGTTAMFRVPAELPVFDTNENKLLQAYALNKNVFLNGGALNNASLAVNWLQSQLFEIDPNNKELTVQPQNDPLFCIPYLTGERESKTGAYSSGVFFGLRASHSKTDITRAVLEGVVYSLYNIYEVLVNNHIGVDRIVMGGGGAKTFAWPHLIANVFNLPVHLATEDEGALLGSALLFRNDFSNEPEKMNTVEPQKDENKIHQQKRTFFNKLKGILGPVFEESISTFNDFQK